VSADVLSPVVRELIAAAIDSVAQLEILLLMKRDPSRPWTPESLAAELRMGAPGIREQLDAMRLRGLVAATDGSYVYNAAGERAAAANELAAVYASYPVAVITAIYSKPAPDLKNFADAFRLRRPEAGGAGGPAGGEGGAGG
jgi:hypothetical protein